MFLLAVLAWLTGWGALFPAIFRSLRVFFLSNASVDLTFCFSAFLPLSLQADVSSEASSVKSACSWSLSSQLSFPLPSSPAVNRLLSLPCSPFFLPLLGPLQRPSPSCAMMWGVCGYHKDPWQALHLKFLVWQLTAILLHTPPRSGKKKEKNPKRDHK